MKNKRLLLLFAFIWSFPISPPQVSGWSASPPDSATMQKAQTLHRLLTGMNLLDEAPYRLELLEAIQRGNLADAAGVITDRATGSRHFYDTVVRNFAITYNREESANVEANDLTAFIIGITRDDHPFTDILTADYFYMDPLLSGVNAYREDRNTHFNYLDKYKSFRDSLRQTSSGGGNIGIFTRRSFAADFYDMGTLRRPIKAIVELLYLASLEEVASPVIPDGRVRRDVPRIGTDGTMRLYETSCRTCHTWIDPISSVFMVYDFNTKDAKDRLDRLPSFREKINEINGPTYKPETNDWWLYVTDAQNQVFGYQDIPAAVDSPEIKFAALGGGLKLAYGLGLRSFARVIANSAGFARGLVKRVVCQMYLKKVWSAPNLTEEDKTILEAQAGVMNRLYESLLKHKMLRVLFEEAAVEYMK